MLQWYIALVTFIATLPGIPLNRSSRANSLLSSGSSLIDMLGAHSLDGNVWRTKLQTQIQNKQNLETNRMKLYWQFVQKKNFENNRTLRVQIYPMRGIFPIFLFWGWDWNPQSYSWEVSGFLGTYILKLFSWLTFQDGSHLRQLGLNYMSKVTNRVTWHVQGHVVISIKQKNNTICQSSTGFKVK